MAYRDEVINVLTHEPNTHTRKSLADELHMSAASLASTFSQLRLMGKYPVANADGLLSLSDTPPEVSSKPTKTPEEQHESLEKAVLRCGKLQDAATKAYNADSTNEEKRLLLAYRTAELDYRDYLLQAFENAVNGQN
jgi:hypothetical protein